MKWLEQRRQQSAFQDLPKQAQDLIAKIRAQLPRADLDIVREAYLSAETAHTGQTRASGEPYISHSVAVSSILADLRLDPITIAAALLHDVAEDTGVTLDEVRQRFREEVTILVDGVTKLGRIEWQTREERQAESLRKMFLAMASDIRIVLIKLADRLHNMQTIAYLPQWKQQRTSQETLDIYAPLAERLGISQIQRELEDFAFGVLQPDAYADLKGQLVEAEATSRAGRNTFTACGRSCSGPSTPASRSPVSTTGSAYGSSSTTSRTATRPWASCNLCGNRSPASSTTTSLTPRPAAISPCTPRSCTKASRWRSRSARCRCTRKPSTVSPHTGSTRRGGRSSGGWTTSSPGCGSCWTGIPSCRTRAISCSPSASICSRTRFSCSPRRATSSISRLGPRRWTLPTASIRTSATAPP